MTSQAVAAGLLGALFSLGCGGSGSAANQRVQTDGEWECSDEGFGMLPALDTTQMRVRQVDWHPPNASEGVMARAFYGGPDPEIITVTTFGESGRAITTYRLRDRDDFQATHAILRYSEPITEGGVTEALESRVVITYCDGRAEATREPELAETLDRLLAEVFERLSDDGG